MKLSEMTNLHKKPGPMAYLVHTFQKYGFTVDFTNYTVQLDGLQIPWLEVSLKTFKRLLSQAWIRLVSNERIDRKDYDIDEFDVYANKQAFLKLDFHDRSLVEQFFTGRHFTHDMLAKFLPDVPPTCPMCGETDSREHRLFHCSELSKFRVRFRRIKHLQTQWKHGNWFFGLCPCVEHAHQAITRWCNSQRLILQPLDSVERVYVFVDGSAFFGETQALTISAAAWVQTPWEQKSVCDFQRAPVPGADQSSFAAEIFAILMVLNIFRVVTIYTDCSAVFDFVSMLLDENRIGEPKCALPFFGVPVADHIAKREKGNIEIRKVRSHQSLKNAANEHDSWLIWGNDMADKHAKEVMISDNRQQFRTIEKLHKQTLQFRRDIEELYRYIAVIGNYQLQVTKELRVREVEETPFRPDDIHELRFPTHGHPVVPTLDADHFLAYTWGSVYLWRIVTWLQGLRWDSSPHAGCDISFVELYIDFCLTTSSRAPVNVFSTQERQKYGYYNFALMDLETRADVAVQNLAQQTETWTRSILWLHKHCPQKFFPANVISRSISLSKLGCSSWHKAFDRRPILHHGFRAAHILHKYFCSGHGTHRNFSKVLDMAFDAKPAEVPAWLLVPFHARVAYMRRSKDIFAELNS
eukprot:Skav225054  [mRNA]  locus=scaffold3690:14004:15914:- [translate_table: standard]